MASEEAIYRMLIIVPRFDAVEDNSVLTMKIFRLCGYDLCPIVYTARNLERSGLFTGESGELDV